MPKLLPPLAIAAALLAAGCATRPVDLIGCDLPRYPLEVAAPDSTRAAAADDPGAGRSYQDIVREAVRPRSGSRAVDPPALLFMSGGGQHGAFGAGLLDGWAAKAGGLPEFRVVTGISTGALLGSFAFAGRPELAVKGYSIDAESDLLNVTARGTLALARKGAAGDLGPLRRHLAGLLDDELLGRIGDAHGQGRRFLVGVVDVRSGDAAAIDLTEYAAPYRAAAAPEKARRKRCYIEALVASSSVPLGAPPVYIDGAMYIDGGARFGLFYAAQDEAVRAIAPRNYLIVNGTLELKAQCPFETAKGAACPATGTLRDWDIADLGLRSVDILQNQIYRFSADYAARPGVTGFAKIEPDAKSFVTAIPGEAGERSCTAWRELDQTDKPPPVQFDKRYMHCLIAYGRDRAARASWTAR